MLDNETIRKAMVGDAWQNRRYAYAPYSNYKVGAAVRIKQSLYYGWNIENMSYGLTICAERVALCDALVRYKQNWGTTDPTIDELVFATDTPGEHFGPCGACLQFISEFALLDCLITHYNGQTSKTWRLNELLPHNGAKTSILTSSNSI